MKKNVTDKVLRNIIRNEMEASFSSWLKVLGALSVKHCTKNELSH